MVASFILGYTLVVAAQGKQCANQTERVFEVRATLDIIKEASARRDGSLGATIGGAIVELLLVNPRETLKWLTTNAGTSDMLMEEMETSVFTDYVGNRSEELSKRREQLICILEALEIRDAAVDKQRSRLLAKIRSVKIRSID